MSDGPAAADHLSLDELAELEEGIAANADALRGHLDGCALCRERAGQLNASRALLSTLPQEPMPADVAARIDAALAAEPAPAAGMGGTIVPMRPRRAWLRGPNVAAAAAGVAVVALGAALVVGHVGQKSSPAAKDARNNGAVGTGPLGVAAPNFSGLKQWQTGHNYTDKTLQGYVTGLVVAPPPPFPTPTPTPTPATATTPTSTLSGHAPASYSLVDLRDPATVYACAALLEARPVTPIAIDYYASFNGVPAVILVLPGLGQHTSEFDVWILYKTCSTATGDVAFRRVPRPPGH